MTTTPCSPFSAPMLKRAEASAYDFLVADAEGATERQEVGRMAGWRAIGRNRVGVAVVATAAAVVLTAATPALAGGPHW